jgi:hypothetical protein
MLWLLLYSFFLGACTPPASQETHDEAIPTEVRDMSSPIDPNGRTIATRFPAPEGFVREPMPQGSFAQYLRQCSLKVHGSPVKLYDGRIKQAQVHAAVLDLDVGKRDLQQCADAIIRLRAEYWYEKQQFDAIAFNFTNGFRCAYRPWINGQRIQIQGNRTWWSPKADTSESYLSFRKYLDVIFSYAGTWSLERELSPVAYQSLQIGDVLIHGGSPGHAVIVVDMVVNPGSGDRLYLLAQSYMPAQEIHILKNPSAPQLSPWYQLDPEATVIRSPEWTFRPEELRRFQGEG